MDRRTVAKRLENIKPHRTEGVAKHHSMADAAPASLDSAPKLLTEDGEVVDSYAERPRLTTEQAGKAEMGNGRLRKEPIRFSDRASSVDPPCRTDAARIELRQQLSGK